MTATYDPCTKEQLGAGWKDVSDNEGAPQCQSPGSAKEMRVRARSNQAVSACRRSIAEFGQSLILDALQLKTLQWTIGASAAIRTYYRFGDWPAHVSRATLGGVSMDPTILSLQFGSAYLGDEPYMLDGLAGGAYRVSRGLPVIGSGLELGEALNVCLGGGG